MRETSIRKYHLKFNLNLKRTRRVWRTQKALKSLAPISIGTPRIPAAQVLAHFLAATKNNKVSLENILKAHEVLTGKLGDVNRQLVFAGIGILWIFKFSTPAGTLSLPPELHVPAMLFVASLTADLLQYAYSSVLYSIMFHVYEYNLKKQSTNKEEFIELASKVNHHRAWDYPSYALLSLKVILSIVGYLFLLRYLVNTLME